MKRLLIFFLLSTFLLKANLAFAYIETSENIKLDKVPTTKTLNLPDPARGWIDYSKWTCDNSAITITEMTASAYLSISKNFSGTAKVECVYVAKWYDSKGFTQSDTYLRTFYITYNSSAPEKLEVTITPNGGSVTRGTTVKFKCNSESATIYYTDDGSNPSKSSYKYIGEGYSISEPVTLKAIAYNGTQSSDIVSASFTIDESKIVKFKTIEGIEVTAVKYLSKGSYKLGLGEGAYTPCIDKSYKGKLTIPEKVNGMPVISITKHAFLNCKLTDIILPEGLTTIYTEAFSGCSLETITLPSTITTIANYSFEFCYLESIYCKDTTPGTIGTNAFSSITYRDAILYVPIGTQSLYRNKKGWSEFSKIREYDNSPKIYVSDISITPQSKTLKVGDTFTFSAVVSPENATDKSVTWKSSNTQIATVSDNGTVSAKSVGTAMITCTAKDGSGKSASCELKVTAQDVLVTSIQLNKTSDELDVGQTSQLTATVYPSNATNKAFTWTSSNSSVATVSTSGLVTAKGVGTATITCSAKDLGNAKATCMIKVNPIGNGLYYNGIRFKIIADKSVKVVSLKNNQKYKGKVIIPASFYINNNLYSVLEIDENAFMECNDLIEVAIPNSVTKIGTWAFYSCKNLSVVSMPNSVIELGEGAFYYCYNLTSVSIPNKLNLIKINTFRDCRSLTSIEIPTSVTKIDIYAFSGCNSLTSVTIPSTVKELSGTSFAGCTKLTEIMVDERNENYCSMDGVLFNKDKSILMKYPGGKMTSRYVVPNTVTEIDFGAFSYNKNLNSVCISNSVKEIGILAFSNCLGLTSVTIPDSIIRIGFDAFLECNALTSVWYISSTPISAADDLFSTGAYRNATLYVPAESINKFKQISPWKNFKNINAYDPASVDAVIADSEPPLYFDLQGLRVETPVKGRLYIRLQNGKAEKVFIE